MITRDDFWIIADDTRLETEYVADRKLHYLQIAPLETLQNICLQYRYFIKEYPNNLGVLVSKLPYGKMKSLMAQILAEELGEGDNNLTHLRLFDDFLLSIGISEDALENSINQENTTVLKDD
ncbi:iron-containing redox enzyme family protein [Aliinostoc sp. HNIBRCY26]|uniref:iron-containing redox enzyme family protein n=1 Tax=Aliinostoc sp. HNIBRCY26 TaxID=3418997 RepID=UPI003D073994